MNEALEKVSHDLSFVVSGLRDALSKSNNVEEIIVLPMIGEARGLLNRVDSLLFALISDADEKCKE